MQLTDGPLSSPPAGGAQRAASRSSSCWHSRPQRLRPPAVVAAKGKGFGETVESKPEKDGKQAGSDVKEPEVLPGSSYKGAKPFEEQQRRLAAEGGTDVERFVLQFLGIFFGVVILEGVVLAASGFLPEDVDSLIVQVLYPTYTPTLGIFFACSALYGVWKSTSASR